MHSAQKRRSAQRSSGATSSHRGSRGRGRRGYYLLGTVAAAALIGTAAVAMNGSSSNASSSLPPSATARALPPDSTASTTTGAPPPSTTAPTSAALPTAASVPTHGSGVFTTARASGKTVGRGAKVRRYKVEVEEGTGVSATSAAREIEAILADPKGWTTNGTDSFKLVSSGSYDFEIKIGTADTTDRLCLVGGLHTHGEVNCDVGDQVMVNLKRWVQGSPEFDGPIGEYRALIINHEVGHRIGHGHEGCPGPGRPAPAMMQQIDGLHGCVANAWPYDAHGHYLGGPHIP